MVGKLRFKPTIHLEVRHACFIFFFSFLYNAKYFERAHLLSGTVWLGFHVSIDANLLKEPLTIIL